MGLTTKEVRFDKWCPKCVHKDESEFDCKSACFECLYHFQNNDSTKPIEFKEVKS